MTLTIDGILCQTPKQTHDYLHSILELPDYYGSNADALFDALMTIHTPLNIIIINADALQDTLGDYGETLLKVFTAINTKNPRIKVTIM